MQHKKDLLTGRVLKLKEDASLGNDLNFKKGQEFELVKNMVYMRGVPVQPNMQQFLYNWIMANPKLFVDDTRTW